MESRCDVETNNRVWKALDVVSKISCPSTVLLVTGRLIGVPTVIAEVAFLVVVVVLGIALWLRNDAMSKVLRILLPISCLILVGLWVWVIFVRTDPWRDWKNSMTEAVENCKNDDDVCIANVVDDAYTSLPKPGSDLLVERLADDARAGTLLLQNEVVFAMLDRRLGLKRHFLGNGLAVPISGKTYDSARFLEYLVPTYEVEKNADAMVTLLDPKGKFHDKTIEEIVDLEIANTKRSEIKDFKVRINKALADPNRPAPVIRIQQFPREFYKGYFGQKNAKRVFFLDLDAVWKMTLTDASNWSGFAINPKSENSADIIFVWVFLPSNPSEAIPATWSNILPNTKAWVEGN